MKRFTICALILLISLTMSSCNGSQSDKESIALLNNMEELSSYKAVINIENSELEVDKSVTLLYKDGVTLMYYSDFPYIYKELDGDNKILVWMETKYYSFDIPQFDMIHLFDFDDYNDKGVTQVSEERYSVKNYGDLNMFNIHVKDDLIHEMGFNYQIDSGEVMHINIEFTDYNNTDFSYTGTAEVPEERQNYLYTFYEYGYHVKITDIDLRLFGVNYIVRISRDDDYIKVFVDDWYYEINPNTKEVAVVTKSNHVIFSNEDFFRLNRDFHFTKEDVNTYIDLYDNYLSIYSN